MKKLYDSGKILTGLFFFLAIVTSPFWYNKVSGKGAYVPELKIEKDEKECVRRTGYMKKSHMELLRLWRDEAVRKGNRIYFREDGKKFEISLSGSCLNCHKKKDEFCDRCHGYVGVTPKCWTCHNVPQEANK